MDLIVFLTICLLPFSADAAAANTLDSFLRGAGCLRIPLERTADNRMIVHGMLNGEPLALYVDTGSGGTVLDARRVARFKLSQSGMQKNIFGAFGRPMPAATVVARSLRFGKLNVNSMPLRVSELKMDDTDSVSPADGLLGMDFLGHMHAIIDCANAVLYFPPPNSSQNVASNLSAGLIAGGAAVVPLTRNMMLPAAVRDQTFRLMLDTGSAFTSIAQTQLDALRLRPAGSPYIITAIGNLRRTVATTTIKNLRLGDCVIRESTIGAWDFSDLNNNLAQQNVPRIQGLLGCELLWLYGAIVDCGSQRLFLTHRNGAAGR